MWLEDYEAVSHHERVGDEISGFTTTRINGHVLRSIVRLDEEESIDGARNPARISVYLLSESFQFFHFQLD